MLFHRALVRTVFAIAAAALGHGACAPPKPASFADDDKVVAAQKKWCAGLEKHASKDSYSYSTECEAARLTGSADFIAGMTKCYDQQLTDFGENVPDMAVLVQQCTEQVLYNTDPGDVSASPTIKARCARMNKCEKVEVSACTEAIASLSGAQRATISAMYNLDAQWDIARCLEDTDCSPDEDATRLACFKPARSKRVWLPFL